MKKLLPLVDQNALMFFFPNARMVWAQDTKMNWMFSGKTHGGVFSCIACLRPSNTSFDDQFKLRTFGETAADAASYSTFVDGRSDNLKKTSYKKFNNCVRPSLLSVDGDDIILEKLPPNPLHMKLRSVNKVIHELEKAHPEVAASFFKQIGVKKERYHDEFEVDNAHLSVGSMTC